MLIKNYDLKNAEALTYCKDNGFNEDYYFLQDLSVYIPEKNRF
jgi:hypothetical protein